MYLALLLIVPLLISLVAFIFSKGKIMWQELIIQEILLVLVLAGCAGLAHYTSVTDTELLNGRVTNRERKEVSCSHSYDCNCYTTCSGSGKDETCTQHCSTCYEHSYDVSWYVYTNVYDNYYTIDRVDRQGLDMPPRWATVYPNEPVVVEHRFDNYVKASPSTVLRKYFADPKLKDRVPEYPAVYDYYRANKVLTDGVTLKGPASWFWLLTNINSDLGNKKQVNVILIVTSEANSDYEFAVQDKWIGGKKNDVIVLIGAPHAPEIAWARVVSWTDVYDLKVKLRDDIMNIGTLDKRDEIVGAIQTDIDKLFIRKHWDDYKYLMASYQPSGGVTLFLFLLGVIASVGSTFYVYNNEFEDMETRPKSTFHYLQQKYFRRK